MIFFKLSFVHHNVKGRELRKKILLHIYLSGWRVDYSVNRHTESRKFYWTQSQISEADWKLHESEDIQNGFSLSHFYLSLSLSISLIQKKVDHFQKEIHETITYTFPLIRWYFFISSKVSFLSSFP